MATNPLRRSRGRQRIPLQLMQNDSNRYVTFSKRRAGLFKKASEICTLCGVEATIIVFSPGKKVFSFGHPSVDKIVNRFLQIQGAPDQNPNLGEDLEGDGVKLLNKSLALSKQKNELELKRSEELQEFRNSRDPRLFNFTTPERITMEELKQLLVFFEWLRDALFVHISRLEHGNLHHLAFLGQNFMQGQAPAYNGGIFGGQGLFRGQGVAPYPNQEDVFGGHGLFGGLGVAPNPNQETVFGGQGLFGGQGVAPNPNHEAVFGGQGVFGMQGGMHDPNREGGFGGQALFGGQGGMPGPNGGQGGMPGPSRVQPLSLQEVVFGAQGVMPGANREAVFGGHGVMANPNGGQSDMPGPSRVQPLSLQEAVYGVQGSVMPGANRDAVFGGQGVLPNPHHEAVFGAQAAMPEAVLGGQAAMHDPNYQGQHWSSYQGNMSGGQGSIIPSPNPNPNPVPQTFSDLSQMTGGPNDYPSMGMFGTPGVYNIPQGTPQFQNPNYGGSSNVSDIMGLDPGQNPNMAQAPLQVAPNPAEGQLTGDQTVPPPNMPINPGLGNGYFTDLLLFGDDDEPGLPPPINPETGKEFGPGGS